MIHFVLTKEGAFTCEARVHGGPVAREGARITEIARWIERNLVPTQSFCTYMGSYGLKHIAEAELGYVSNGEFISAALALGFRMKVENGGPNAVFNMSTKSIKETMWRLYCEGKYHGNPYPSKKRLAPRSGTSDTASRH